MDSITLTQINKNLNFYMNKVCDDHVPIIIIRQNAKPVIIMSLEDCNAFETTLYLLKSPKNAMRLSKAMHYLRQKKFISHNII